MRWWNGLMLTLVVFVLLSCNQQHKNDVKTPVNKALKSSRKLPTSITIWRYGNFPVDKARKLKRHLDS